MKRSTLKLDNPEENANIELQVEQGGSVIAITNQSTDQQSQNYDPHLALLKNKSHRNQCPILLRSL